MVIRSVFFQVQGTCFDIRSCTDTQAVYAVLIGTSVRRHGFLRVCRNKKAGSRRPVRTSALSLHKPRSAAAAVVVAATAAAAAVGE